MFVSQGVVGHPGPVLGSSQNGGGSRVAICAASRGNTGDDLEGV